MPAVDYSWARSIVSALCKLNPANLSLCLSDERATQMYVLLAIRGWDRQPLKEPLAELAERIAFQPRRRVLQSLWGGDLGAPALLGHCTGSIWLQADLDRLAEALSNPSIRPHLARHRRISRADVQSMLDAVQGSVSADRFGLYVRYGRSTTDYLVTSLKQRRPQLSESTIIEALNRTPSKLDLDETIYRLLFDTPLPPPPWLGDNDIKPLRTLRAIREVGQRFSNCLINVDYGLRALSGAITLYTAEIDAIPYCVSVQRDRVLQAWRVVEFKGIKNSKPKGKAKSRLLARFDAVGIPCLPEPPLMLWFD